jgi:hypothetical protein
MTHPSGSYTYQTTFDLTGFDPNSAQISGFLAADNAVLVYLNSAPPAGSNSSRASAASADVLMSVYAKGGYSFTPGSFANQSFSITGGFQPGLNTLTFVVFNEVQDSGNPTGLRVAVSGTADLLPTPEPTTAAVFAGLLGAAAYIRRTARRRPGAAV